MDCFAAVTSGSTWHFEVHRPRLLAVAVPRSFWQEFLGPWCSLYIGDCWVLLLGCVGMVLGRVWWSSWGCPFFGGCRVVPVSAFLGLGFSVIGSRVFRLSVPFHQVGRCSLLSFVMVSAQHFLS